jgi:hypothetical protein
MGHYHIILTRVQLADIAYLDPEFEL